MTERAVDSQAVAVCIKTTMGPVENRWCPDDGSQRYSPGIPILNFINSTAVVQETMCFYYGRSDKNQGRMHSEAPWSTLCKETL